MEPYFLNSASAHSWNKDHSQLAVSPNNSEIQIWETKGQASKDWKLLHTLTEHFMTVTGIDWNHETNSIATSGHDRNAYVWQLKNNEWKPTLVVLRIGRAATCIKWSPDGKKFAVGSGSKQIPVCHYEKSQDMWVAKMVKKGPKSTILCVDWSPNNMFIIAGGSDFKCRIYSGYIKEVDGDLKLDDTCSSSFGGDKNVSSFGNILAEFDQSRGWIEACRFSPSGTRFAFAGHDSTVHFGEITTSAQDVQTILRHDLPLRSIVFLTDTMAIGGGYDNVPIIYEYNNGNWEEKGSLDTGALAKAATQGKDKGAFGAAFSKFDQATKLGHKQVDLEVILPFRHQNVINDMCVWSEKEFTTSSFDGRILVWDMSKKY